MSKNVILLRKSGVYFTVSVVITGFFVVLLVVAPFKENEEPAFQISNEVLQSDSEAGQIARETDTDSNANNDNSDDQHIENRKTGEIYKGEIVLTPNIQGDTLQSQTRVFYNRMPKCGSRTVQDIINNITTENNFSFIELPDDGRTLNESSKREFVEFFETLPYRVVATKHFHYLDFREHGSVNPIYINLIRHPMDVLMSNYYTKLQKECVGEECDNILPYDDCVRQRMFKCTADQKLNKYLPFLCGHDDECGTLSLESAQKAKANVMKEYMIVGCTDDMRGFFQVLEYLLPSYFRNSVRVYDYYQSAAHQYYTSGRAPPATDTTQYLVKRLKYSIDFYKWAKAYFYDYRNNLIKTGKIKY